MKQERQSEQAVNARNAVETGIETEDSVDLVDFHDGQMDCVPSAKVGTTKNNFLRSACRRQINRQDLIDNSEEGIERRLYRFPAVN